MVVPEGDGGVPEPELPPLQPSVPPKATRHRRVNRRPPRHRRRGSTPRKSNTASAKRYLSNSPAGVADAVAAVVETVSVLEIGELPVTCACDGLREQVGGLFGVPCP